MNKLMLGAAAVALFVAATPAMAQDDSGVKLSLGGYFKGYVNYSDEDAVRDLDILRETEVHFGGETTLDNGLTVGAHIEAATDAGEGFEIDESYVYFAGTWGRVNFGAEDGAAYLLQVAAPSADDNIDGIRQYINPVTFTGTAIDYDNDLSTKSDKVTYLSPVFSGFQAGASFTPEAGDASRSVAGNSPEGVADTDDVWELAVRYEGMVSDVGVILGAGYADGGDNTDEWNVGADLDIGAFGLGLVYTETEVASVESDTWVVGGDYTVGPYKLGISYLNTDDDADTYDVARFTGGVVYTYGPGMTFRGSIAYTDDDVSDEDATTVTVGTQINF